MTEAENVEYMNLINLWNCSEPMTPAQLERMRELDEFRREDVLALAKKVLRELK